MLINVDPFRTFFSLGGNFFSKMGRGQPYPINLDQFLKFFVAVGIAKGEKILNKLLFHVEKGVPQWLHQRGSR